MGNNENDSSNNKEINPFENAERACRRISNNMKNFGRFVDTFFWR